MEPVLSIITINRNNASGLKTTMQSVFAQNIKKSNLVEYIVIDGASTDNSVNVIKSIEKANLKSKIKLTWISSSDTGIYNAMNKGLKLATGSLIGIMNSGDSYLPDVFDKILSIYKENPDSILYGPIKTFTNGEFESIWGYNYKILERQMIPHLGTFVPKSYYDKYGTFDESYKLAGDYELFLRFYTKKAKFLFIDTIICNFNLEGISQKNGQLAKEETDRVKKQYGFFIPPTKIQIFKNTVKKLLPFLK